MRLINTTTGAFHTFETPNDIPYAILSHVWAKEDDPHFCPEPTYEDICRIQREHASHAHDAERTSIISQLPEKIRRFCETAASQDLDYAWGDSFCIDKTSSAELSEAINSMFNWYRCAAVCYAYLHDVPSAATALGHGVGSLFYQSAWHKRGWTLQELLAPEAVVFYSADWTIIGTKHALATEISEVTNIHRDVLTSRRSLYDFSVACRMSWAASRKTTRKEDEAYSLLGILGVNMPIIYGEGSLAFIRLQEEILKHIPDQTIFTWGSSLGGGSLAFHSTRTSRAIAGPLRLSSPPLTQFGSKLMPHHEYLFASSPLDFQCSTKIKSVPHDALIQTLNVSSQARTTYTATPYGIHTRLPLVRVTAASLSDTPTCSSTYIALLACAVEDDSVADGGKFVGLLLRHTQPGGEYLAGTVIDAPVATSPTISSNYRANDNYYRIVYLSRTELDICAMKSELTEVYIPYRPSPYVSASRRDTATHESLYRLCSATGPFEVHMSKWSQNVLEAAGYRANHQRPGRDNQVIDIENTAESAPEVINITIGRCECHYGEREDFLSVYVDVSHNPGPSVSARAPSTRHASTQDHHIYSWAFYNSTASKDFHLRLRTKNVTVRLTLKRTKGSDNCSSKYLLGVVIWEAAAPELAEPEPSMGLQPSISIPSQLKRKTSVSPTLARSTGWHLDTEDPVHVMPPTPSSCVDQPHEERTSKKRRPEPSLTSGDADNSRSAPVRRRYTIPPDQANTSKRRDAQPASGYRGVSLPPRDASPSSWPSPDDHIMRHGKSQRQASEPPPGFGLDELAKLSESSLVSSTLRKWGTRR
ncbi:HET-domain-containing protein [Cubamyces sp. BRFM 1775]|nr:HET-domain-containing protein [Cubamyces sp. BRFM 1775]